MLLHCILLCHMVLHGIVLYCIVLHCIALYRMVSYVTLWYPIPLHAFALLASARGLRLARRLYTSEIKLPEWRIYKLSETRGKNPQRIFPIVHSNEVDSLEFYEAEEKTSNVPVVLYVIFRNIEFHCP